MTRLIARVTFIAAMLIGATTSLPAQQHALSSCDPGWTSFGALGIAGFSCDCTLSRKDDNRFGWTFRGEPVITDIIEDGPASGKLRRGDVIVSIDGLLITTRAAGERVASLREGQQVTLTIRRNGRVSEVEIETSEDCTDLDMADVAVPAPPAVPPRVATTRGDRPRQPRPPVTTAPGARTVPPAPPGVTTPGARTLPPAPPAPPSWFGFGISCHNCKVLSTEKGDIWSFSEYPTIYSVDPDSPADEAGLRRGDVLLKIDGISLLEPEGVERFAGIETGQTVTWTYRRGGTTRTARMTAAAPRGTRADLSEMRAALERMQVDQERELTSDMTRLRGELLLAERQAGAGNREHLESSRALLDSLLLERRLRSDENLVQLRRQLAATEQELRTTNPAIAGSEEQHLRFAGMVGNTNVEVRGLSSVDVSYDNSTGELLIRTMDSTIRVKAPTR